MIDLSSLFMAQAWAQEAAPQADAPSAMMSMVPFILIFAVFYFLVIRPQQKKLAEHDRMIKALKCKDGVVTSGGIHGTIATIDEKAGTLTMEIADGVTITVNRDSVSAVAQKEAGKTA